jgi:DNA-binding SARP family transcriptional activator
VSATSFHLRSLGAIDLRDGDGAEVRSVLAQPKRFALLTYLVVEGERGFARRDALATLLWPALDDAHARGSLRQSVRFLRKALAADVIESCGEESLTVRATVSCDAVAFEHACAERNLATALELYRGTFLDGFVLPGASEFEQWLQVRRADLRELATHAASALAQREEAAGNTAAAMKYARRLVALAPHDEAAERRLIALLNRTGNRAGALAEYETFEQRLAEDYDVEPSVETRALMRSVRASSSLSSERTSEPDHTAAQRKRDGVPAYDSVAVLAFRDAQREGGSDYFTEGITDELIAALAKVSGLRVLSRSAGLAALSSDSDLRPIGERLKVDAVVEGTVWRSADRLRIGARLTSTSDGLVLWAQTYDRTSADVFAVQDHIAQELARILRPDQRPGRVASRTNDIDAYKLYLKGRHHFSKRPRETLRSLDYFEQAIARDPNFALAHAGVADAYNTLGSWEAGLLPAADAAPKARRAAESALAIDPGLAEAHTALAYASTHFLWRWDEAERGFRRAIALNEHYLEAHHWFSHLLMARGRTAESLAESEHCLALDPVSVVMNFHLAWHYWLARDYDACIEQCHKTLELDPHDQWPPFFLGMSYVHKGMFGAAISEHRKALARSNGSPVMLGALGYAHVIAGDDVAALEVLRQLEHLSTQRHVSAYEIGVIHAARGDADLAFRWLDRAFVERSAWLAYLNVEPRLDVLRADSRFASLLRRVGHGAESGTHGGRQRDDAGAPPRH